MTSFDPSACSLCPRACLADRAKQEGFCGGGGRAKIARAGLHFWEEPCISGKNGSGAVFFSGCSLKCAYCQNDIISAGNFGKEVSAARLSEIFMELQSGGAHNINLVTPTHYVPWIIKALDLAKPELQIPVVYNCGGYESVETLRMLSGYVDVYLPDLKYKDAGLSARYSSAPDYFEKASEALLEMYRQTGDAKLDEEGMLTKGLLIRHLVLPCAYRDSVDIIKWIEHSFPAGGILVSVMRQYTPPRGGSGFRELDRRLTTFEYEKVASAASELNLRGFFQDRDSAQERYTPAFDLTGV